MPTICKEKGSKGYQKGDSRIPERMPGVCKLVDSHGKPCVASQKEDPFDGSFSTLILVALKGTARGTDLLRPDALTPTPTRPTPPTTLTPPTVPTVPIVPAALYAMVGTALSALAEDLIDCEMATVCAPPDIIPAAALIASAQFTCFWKFM